MFTERPHPWILAVGIDPETDEGQLLARYGPSVRFESMDSIDTGKTRLVDFHAIVSVGPIGGEPLPGTRILKFLDDPSGYLPTFGGANDSRLFLMPANHAAQFRISEDADRDLRPLLQRSILEHLSPESEYDTIHVEPPAPFVMNGASGSVVPTGSPTGKFVPLLEEVRGQPIAGVMTSHEPTGEWFLLPELTTHRSEWIRTVFERWHKQDAELFPASRWRESERWMTHEAITARQALTAWDAETERIIKARNERSQDEVCQGCETVGLVFLIRQQQDAADCWS